MSDTSIQLILDKPLIPDDDEPEVSHIVKREDQLVGYISGRPIVALCGVVFVPTRDPERYPICPKCTEKLKQLRSARLGAN